MRLTGQPRALEIDDPLVAAVQNAVAEGLVVVVSAGNFGGWARRLGGTRTDYGTDIAVDSTGDIVVTGGFQGNVDFDPGTAVTNRRSSADSIDAFVWKLNASGNYRWSYRAGGTAVPVSRFIDAQQNFDLLANGISFTRQRAREAKYSK